MLSTLVAIDVPRTQPDFSANLLVEEPIDDASHGQPFVLVHPVTGWGNKDYPEARWSDVVRNLGSHGFDVLIAPGPGEEGVAARIAESAPNARALPPPSLPGLVYLQRRARLVLGGDTGPVHLAHALGTPVLCIMGPTDPHRHGPYAAPEAAISHSLPCSYCYKRMAGARACLLAIDARVVTDRALRSLRFESH